MESVEVSQSALYLYSAALGIVLGAVYDCFRILRLIFGTRRITLFVEDILFCIICAVSFTVLLFNASLGQIRFFAFAGMVFGFAVYYFTIGKLTAGIVMKIKAWLSPVIRSAILRQKKLIAAICTVNDARKFKKNSMNGFGC